MIRSDFVFQLQHMEQEAARNKLWLTKRALNIAVKVIGWEMAGNADVAAKVRARAAQDGAR